MLERFLAHYRLENNRSVTRDFRYHAYRLADRLAANRFCPHLPTFRLWKGHLHPSSTERAWDIESKAHPERSSSAEPLIRTYPIFSLDTIDMPVPCEYPTSLSFVEIFTLFFMHEFLFAEIRIFPWLPFIMFDLSVLMIVFAYVSPL